MNTYLERARHNRKACDHLHKTGEFSDWVVTTAFYCAMHYVYAAIFPFEETGTLYTTFEQYYNKHKTDKSTKHSVTLDLAFKKFPSHIAAKYKQIKDAAHTARYQDYTHPPEVVKIIRSNLSKIEQYCEQVILDKEKAKETEDTP